MAQDQMRNPEIMREEKFKVGFTDVEMKQLVDTIAMVLDAITQERRRILRKRSLRPSDRKIMLEENDKQRRKLQPLFDRLVSLQPITTVQPFPKV